MKIRRFQRPLAGASLLFLLFANQSTCLGQGSLTPPGPPGPTMKTLDQIQPRTPISSLPYAITGSGSYYVTGNLTGVSGQNGITITASDVSVDLSGFTLTGVTGAKTGIAILGGVSGVSVANGSVNAWPTGGVVAFDSAASKPATGCRFTALHLSGNSSSGLNSGYASLVRDCIAEKNDGNGIYLGQGSTVEHSNSNGNVGAGGFGFLTYFAQQGGGGVFGPTIFNSCNATGNSLIGFFVAGSILTDCMAYSNLSNGFSADSSTLRRCVAYGNKVNGFNASGANFEGCSALFNGNNGSGSGFTTNAAAVLTNCTARSNAADGIALGGAGGLATACTVQFNGGSGISLAEASAVNCTSYGNTGDGIKMSSSGYVARCNSDSNVLSGVHATGTDNRIEGNKVTNNDANGIKVDGTVNLVYGNTARGNSGTNTNYNIVSGNRVGTIVVPTVSGAVTNNSGATSFGLNDPWANIGY